MTRRGTELPAKAFGGLSIGQRAAVGILLAVGAGWFLFLPSAKRNSSLRAAATASAAALPAEQAHHAAAAILASPRESSPVPLSPTVGAVSKTTTEIAASAVEFSDVVLPPPPSGDYDLNLTVEQLEAIVEQRYGPLLQSLKISREQVVRLRELLKERQQVAVDAANAATLFGLDPVRDLPATRAAIEQFQSAVDDCIRTEFGEDVFTSYRDFDQTLRERNTVAQIVRQAAAAGPEISAAQQKQLVRILKIHPGPAQPVDLNRVIFGDVNTRAAVSEAALTQAASLLSPDQLKLLRNIPKN